MSFNQIDTPPSSLMDSTMNPKVKVAEGEKVRARALACNISRVKGRARTPKWRLGRLTSKSITHTNLHKPNIKFVSV